VETGEFGKDEPLNTINERTSIPGLQGCFGQNLQHAVRSRGFMLKTGMKVFLEDLKTNEFLQEEALKMKKVRKD